MRAKASANNLSQRVITLSSRNSEGSFGASTPNPRDNALQTSHLEWSDRGEQEESGGITRHVLRDLIRTAEATGDAFHTELLSALRRRNVSK